MNRRSRLILHPSSFILRMFILSSLFCFLISMTGCEAFVKKFTRKPKKEKPAEEMVVQPEEYPSLFKNKAEAYSQYFLYWKSWQDELINALSSGMSQKKQLSCIEQAIKNLTQLRSLLNEEKAASLKPYIRESQDLRDSIAEDTYSRNANGNRFTAEKLKRSILRDFSYSKVKSDLDED